LLLSSDTRSAVKLTEFIVGAVAEDQENEQFNSATCVMTCQRSYRTDRIEVLLHTVQAVLPTTQLDAPPEHGQLIGAMEHCATSTKRSFLEEQTTPSLSPKAAPHLVQQYLRAASGFTALAAAQRHVRHLYETVLNPARHTIEHNHNLNRAQVSRTESDAKNMATQVVPLETDEKTSKPGRRSSKAKAQEPEQVASPEPAADSTIQGANPQQELDALENQAEAPIKGSYLREKDGYDALSPAQKAACDKDFNSYLDRFTSPLEAMVGETRQDAILRAKREYCAARQEHTAHHREIAKTMLASKINCLNDKYPRDSFSLLKPDVAKEFMATAFYHHAAASKELKSFDKDVFATCKKAALREFSVLSAGIETGAAGAKDFNNTFTINIERPPIGALNQNLRIAVKPLPGKREELSAIFGKCAWYHSNQSGRTPEEREQRRATRAKTTQGLER
jgi:hypothetical protein